MEISSGYRKTWVKANALVSLWGFRGDLWHDEGDTRWVNYNTSPFSSRSTAS